MRSRVLYAALMCLCLPPSFAIGSPTDAIAIVGTKMIEESEVRTWLSDPPDEMTIDWLFSMRKRIVRNYRKQGYEYVRVWPRLHGLAGKPTFYLDEGKMHGIRFVGADAFRALLVKVDLNIPQQIFRKGPLENSIKEIRAKYGLRTAYYRVQQSNQRIPGPHGELVKSRVLRVFLIADEFQGWGAGVALSALWGLLPKIEYGHTGLLLPGDRLIAETGIAIPFRKFLFEEAASFQWVHGILGLTYRFPGLFNTPLIPEFEINTSLSRYERVDLGLATYFNWRSNMLAKLRIAVYPHLDLTFGFGADNINVFNLDRLPNTALSLFDDTSITRFVTLWSAEYEFGENLLRYDLRNYIQFLIRYARSSKERWTLRASYLLQYTLPFGFHRFIARSRAILLTGQVDFWNEQALADGFSNVFFNNRYWVREAIQFEAAFRYSLNKENVKLGVFAQAAFFGDQTTPNDTDIGYALVVGPMLHIVLLDAISMDFGYGFGLAPVGFDHNFVFAMRTIF